MIVRIVFAAGLCFALVVLITGAYSSYRYQKEMANAKKHAEKLYEEDVLNFKQKREGE